MYDSKRVENVKIEELSSKEEKEQKLFSFGEWLKIKLNGEEKKTIGNNIYTEILKIHSDRRDQEELVLQYRNQYHGVVAEKSTPYVGSFNLNVPITPKITDAAEAQTEEAFEDIDPKWTIEPVPRVELTDARERQEKVLDYYSDTEMQDSEAWGKVYHDAFLLGNGWLGMPYRREFERVKGLRRYTNIKRFQEDFPDDFEKYPQIIAKLEAEQPVKLIVAFNQEVKRSPTPEHYEWEDVYVPLKTKGLEGMRKAKVVARRIMMTWADIYREEKEGNFYAGVAESVKWNFSGKVAEIDPEYLNKEYETFEACYLADIDNDNKEERLLARIILPETMIEESDSGSRVVTAQIINYPYFHNRPYIIPYTIKTDRPGIYQDGFGALLQDIHIAANATLNHVLDASVIANSLSLKARAGSDGAKRVFEHRWYPGSVLELASMDDVQQFTFNTPNLRSLVELFVIIERFAGDVTGIVHYLLGQESPDDPEAPFKKQRALTRKAEIKLRRYIKNLKRPMNEAGFQALRLIYQFTPEDRLAAIIGEPVGEEKNFLAPSMRTTAQASGFALDRIMAKTDTARMMTMLANEPEFVNDPVRRMEAWNYLAKDWGSDWDKKIKVVLPTPEEMRIKVEKARKAAEEKRLQVGRDAAQKVMQKGGNKEQARQAGQGAIKTYDELLKRQQLEAAQGGKKKE